MTHPTRGLGEGQIAVEGPDNLSDGEALHQDRKDGHPVGDVGLQRLSADGDVGAGERDEV